MFFGFDPGSKQAFGSRHSAKYFLSLTPLTQLQSEVAAGACVHPGAHASTACCSRAEASLFFLPQSRAPWSLLSDGNLPPAPPLFTWVVGYNAGFYIFAVSPQLICCRPAFMQAGWGALRAPKDGAPHPNPAFRRWPLPDWKTIARGGLRI